jgi:DNA-binding ferritin-like protein
MFQKQYEGVLEYADKLAEHVLSRRGHFSSSLHSMMENSRITDDDSVPEKAMDMCQIIGVDVITIIGIIDHIGTTYPALDTILGDLQVWLYKQKYMIESIIA